MMVLDAIEIVNFGPFRGTHRLELPPIETKPIVLIGGLNGAGKTTLLDAITLALYGSRGLYAKYKDRGGYKEFLRSAIHRDAEPTIGASVLLQFRYGLGAKLTSYRVKRAWRLTKKQNVVEDLSVWVDELRESDIEEHWAHEIESILPQAIAPLFFFDGEQIEQLADLEQAREQIRIGIQALLGLDLVEQLQRDFGEVSRRIIARRDGDQSARRLLEEFEGKLRYLEQEKSKLEDQLAYTKAQWRTLRDRRIRVEQAFQQEGGKLYEQRHQLELELARIREQLRSLRRDQVELLSGPLVLNLVRPQLEALFDADRRAQELTTKDTAARAIRLFLSDAREALQLTSDLWLALEKYAKEYFSVDQDASAHMVALPSTQARAQLQKLLDGELDRCIGGWQQLLQRRSELETEEQRISDLLARVPEEGIAQRYIEELMNIDREIAQVQGRLEAYQERLQQIEVEIGHQRRLLERQQLDLFEGSVEQRTLQFIRRAQSNLRKFYERVTKHHLTRIERNITDSFRRLARKSSLLDRIRIREDFSPVLLDEQGREIQTDELSAGERQMLAVSILWGLARSANRRLPMIVDTPLGRLDSEHRERLVQEYFPRASHQVILLSTDEEIDARYYYLLERHVGRAYQIIYNDSTRSSSFVTGYFTTRTTKAVQA